MPSTVAIIDYTLGNLFSVQQACSQVGLEGRITSDPAVIAGSDAVILPGIGAFGDAMRALGQRRLIAPLLDFVGTGKPVVGICLGMQLFMTRSAEFGDHEGLGLIDGTVVRFAPPDPATKVPHIGWNHVWQSRQWCGTPCDNLPDGAEFYFVHSYFVRPADPAIVLSTTEYADSSYCSALLRNNIFGCQFHPERSGPVGLTMYRNIARWVDQTRKSNRGVIV